MLFNAFKVCAIKPILQIYVVIAVSMVIAQIKLICAKRSIFCNSTETYQFTDMDSILEWLHAIVKNIVFNYCNVITITQIVLLCHKMIGVSKRL